MSVPRWMKALVVMGAVGAVISVTAAGGSETKGKYYFKKTCKPCHTKTAEGGEVTPLAKTQAQWKAYFEAGKHAKGKETLDKVLTAQQLVDVQLFLVNHASDSPQPETCGG